MCGIPNNMETILQTRLNALIEAQKTTPRAVSLIAGLGEMAVRDILNGRSREPREGTVRKIANALGVNWLYLIGDIDENAPSAQPRIVAQSISLPIRYRVQAGAWLEVDAFMEAELGSRPAWPNERFVGVQRWYEEVVGNSIDARFPSGSYLDVVSAIDIQYSPRHGDLVIVTRTRAQGSMIERTCKRVEITKDGKVELWGDSRSEPQWNKALELVSSADQESDVIVEIAALVIGGYTPVLY